MVKNLPKHSIAEQIAKRIITISADKLPDGVRRKCEDLLVDIVGLCIAARNEEYIEAALMGLDDDGRCTAIGHKRTLTSAGAAFVNGTAAHGEDFDDTFEGGPVHTGAVIVPAVLAACERHRPYGKAALIGIAIGVEIMCRLSTVIPKAVHKAGFHPTAVFGALAAAVGVSAALGSNERQITDALGVAGSFASGIIEYLSEGSWTKRLHAGWAAQSGLRAALLGRSGFFGPRTVLEGPHGLFHGFAQSVDGRYGVLLDGLGSRWITETLAFKPYPCGTMAHPYIDCIRRLARRGIAPEDIKDINCEVAEGTVHRLWEPLATKQKPPNGYAAKFATPFILATAYLTDNIGLEAFTDAAVTDPATLSLAAKIHYTIDPDNPYPDAFTGHVRAVLNNGIVIEERRPHFRGGANEPLSRAEIMDKFRLNARHGGWSEERSEKALAHLARLFEAGVDLTPLRG